MAFTIIWSDHAREDLRDIVLFIARDNPPVAESFGYLLMSRVDYLAEFPKMAASCLRLKTRIFEKLFYVLTGSFTK